MNRKHNWTAVDMYGFTVLYKKGIIELPANGDFKPWQYYNNKNEKIELYYHPFQTIIIDFVNHSQKISPVDLLFIDNYDSFQSIKKNISRNLKKS